MRCVFRTNPVQSVQDDYSWYCLSKNGWMRGPRDGNASGEPAAEWMSRDFSTIRVGSSYLVLMRDRGRLTLVAGVLTNRKEVGQFQRPISDVMFLAAETDEDETVLCGFAEKCFSAEDAEGLANPTSEVGAAIDEVWKSASLREFAGKFKSCASGTGIEASLGESWNYPRKDMESRRTIAVKIRSVVKANRPFLIAITDRSPGEALESLTNFKGTRLMFSSRVEKAEKCSDFPLIPSRLKLTGKKIVVMAILAMVVVWVIAKLWPTPTTTSTDLPKTLETTSGR